ncbi:MAG: hypothetical protein CMK89_03030 [Pseudomonadales bacterium]|nr:hypothetical protein [Pseudomonadales bacterium]
MSATLSRKQSTPTSLKLALAALLCACGLLLSGWAGSAGAQTITVYHFNPESHSDRNLVLKNTFDQYFQVSHNIELQPVDDRSTFEGLIAESPPSLFIMSDWQFHQLEADRKDLIPYLRGLKDNNDTFHKLLIGKGPLSPQHATVAVSGTDDYVYSLLGKMRLNTAPLPMQQLRLLTVPKDIDALLAVSFGMADAALATENSYEKYALLYRNEYQQLKVLGTSQPQKRLVVALFKQHLPALQSALDALVDMDQTPNGQLGLKLLGLDEWTQLKTTRHEGGQP